MSPRTRDESASVVGASPSVDGRHNDARGRSSTPDTQADNSSQSRADTRRRGAPPNDVSQSPAKKMKRGKYISRACTSCQRRKIKCEGGDPCAQCIARKRPCVSVPRGEGGGQHAKDDTVSIEPNATGCTRSVPSSDDVPPVHREILARLASVERRLSILQPPPPLHGTAFKNSHHGGYHGYGARSVDDHHSPTSAAELEKVLEPDGQTFAGEVSINRAFDGMAASVLDADGGGGSAAAARSSTSPANNGGLSGDENSEARKVRGWLEGVMESHGIVADEEEWRRSLVLYLDEVYVLYPILHPPTLWAVFDGMWENSALWDMSSPGEREQKRLSVAMVCFCLALSRCSVPTRRTDADGVHSAGWGLYSAGVSLMQDITGLSNTASKSLLTLQLLLLRVLYLFRLDATQGAARVLAIAVANGHIMGLHRQSTLERMPVFASQMYCRTWWCLYVLDRRIALESGQPFLIQDCNVDTVLPLELSDEWLGRYAKTAATTADLQADIAAELSRKPVTSITYLQVRIRFSRIISRAWELLYGIRPPTAASSAMIECTDAMLCRLLSKMPSTLAYDPYVPLESQFHERPRWLALQAVVLYTCCTFLRLLIQTLSLSSLKSPGRTEDDELQSITICASLAASILEGNNGLSDDGLKYSFPISHYLTSATMVMATLVSKEPALKRKYAGVILAATQSLHTYCHKTWVSGKMMQWVSRLGMLVKRTLAENPPPDSRPTHDQDAAYALQQPGHGFGDQLTGSQPFPADSDTHSGTTPSSKGGPAAKNSETAVLASGRPGGRIGGSSATTSGAAAPWSAGSGPEALREMSNWLTMPGFDFSPVMDGGMDLDPEGHPAGLMTLSEDLLGHVRSDGLGYVRDPLSALFGPLGRAGFFGIDIDVGVGGMDQAVGDLGSPVMGI